MKTIFTKVIEVIIDMLKIATLSLSRKMQLVDVGFLVVGPQLLVSRYMKVLKTFPYMENTNSYGVETQ